MDTVSVVIGVLQLALGIGWMALVQADRRRPPTGAGTSGARPV
jgi:hypothetical protein